MLTTTKECRQQAIEQLNNIHLTGSCKWCEEWEVGLAIAEAAYHQSKPRRIQIRGILSF